MIRLFWFIIFLAAILLASLYSVGHAAGDCTVSQSDQAVTPYEQEMLRLVNTYRQQHGAVALTLVPSLMRAAGWLDRDMATGRYVDHNDRLGRGPGSRMTDCGFADPYTWRGENIAGGYDSAIDAFHAWQNSPGHNALMLDEKYRGVGIKRYQDNQAPYIYYWTLDAASSTNNEAPINPGPTSVPTTMPTRTLTPTVTTTPTITPTPTITQIPSITSTPTITNTPLPATATPVPHMPDNWMTPRPHYPTLVPRATWTLKPTWTRDPRR